MEYLEAGQAVGLRVFHPEVGLYLRYHYTDQAPNSSFMLAMDPIPGRLPGRGKYYQRGYAPGPRSLRVFILVHWGGELALDCDVMKIDNPHVYNPDTRFAFGK